jgi:tetratricopeptide (TPR) repeat protein
LLASLSKETAIFFLPAALLLPFYIHKGGAHEMSPCLILRRNWPHFLMFIFAGVGYFSFRTLAFSMGDNGVARVWTHVAGEKSVGFLNNLLPILKASGFYAKKLFVPFPLNFAIIQISDLYLYLGVVLCIVVCLLLIRRNLPGFFFVTAYCIGSSALMIPLLRLTWTPLAERYLYIPSAFFVVGMGIFLHEKCTSSFARKFLAVCTCILLGIAVYATASRTLLWQDNLAFFQDTLKKSPGFMPAKNEIANALLARGREQEAISVINSIELPEDLTNYQLGLMSKASAFARKGDNSGARDVLRGALKNPGKFEARIIDQLVKVNESEVLAGRATKGTFTRENVELLNRLHQITGDPFVLYRLGLVHLSAGETAKARDVLQRVVAKAPEKMYYRQTAQKLLSKLPER